MLLDMLCSATYHFYLSLVALCYKHENARRDDSEDLLPTLLF